ncbi:unnamed protein product [Ophioblennius macclurei]
MERTAPNSGDGSSGHSDLLHVL